MEANGSMNGRRRVVITGVGAVTPLGNDIETTWTNLISGRSGAGPITQFDVTNYATKFGCEVKNWDPSKWFDKREIKHVDRFLQFGIAASMMAMEDAKIGRSSQFVASGPQAADAYPPTSTVDNMELDTAKPGVRRGTAGAPDFAARYP